ncbi:MAG: hypothetical protein P8K64_02935 [Acidimicrobiales bacterium]|nr:hypothetical protein [Acidimicrobiales bacterium]
MKTYSLKLLTIVLLAFSLSCSSTSTSDTSAVSGNTSTSTTSTTSTTTTSTFVPPSTSEDPDPLARCEALLPECGYGWDSSVGTYVDLWDLSEDGSEWVTKEEYIVEPQARCLGFVETCGFRLDEETGEYYDFWTWDYGKDHYVDEELIAPGIDLPTRYWFPMLSTGFTYDTVLGDWVDMWELSEDGSQWLVKDEFVIDYKDRCEAVADIVTLEEIGEQIQYRFGTELNEGGLAEGDTQAAEECGYRWDADCSMYYNFWYFDYGTSSYIDHEDLGLFWRNGCTYDYNISSLVIEPWVDDATEYTYCENTLKPAFGCLT